MKHLLALLAGCLACAPLCAIEQAGNTFTLSDAEMALCSTGEGCTVVPKAALRDVLQGAYLTGLRACRNAT